MVDPVPNVDDPKFGVTVDGSSLSSKYLLNTPHLHKVSFDVMNCFPSTDTTTREVLEIIGEIDILGKKSQVRIFPETLIHKRNKFLKIIKFLF